MLKKEILEFCKDGKKVSEIAFRFAKQRDLGILHPVMMELVNSGKLVMIESGDEVEVTIGMRVGKSWENGCNGEVVEIGSASAVKVKFSDEEIRWCNVCNYFALKDKPDNSAMFREILKEYIESSSGDNAQGMILHTLHTALGMMRKDVITKEQFAIIMDEAVCYAYG